MHNLQIEMRDGTTYTITDDYNKSPITPIREKEVNAVQVLTADGPTTVWTRQRILYNSFAFGLYATVCENPPEHIFDDPYHLQFCLIACIIQYDPYNWMTPKEIFPIQDAAIIQQVCNAINYVSWNNMTLHPTVRGPNEGMVKGVYSIETTLTNFEYNQIGVSWPRPDFYFKKNNSITIKSAVISEETFRRTVDYDNFIEVRYFGDKVSVQSLIKNGANQGFSDLNLTSDEFTELTGQQPIDLGAKSFPVTERIVCLLGVQGEEGTLSKDFYFSFFILDEDNHWVPAQAPTADVKVSWDSKHEKLRTTRLGPNLCKFSYTHTEGTKFPFTGDSFLTCLVYPPFTYYTLINLELPFLFMLPYEHVISDTVDLVQSGTQEEIDDYINKHMGDWNVVYRQRDYGI